MEVVPVSVSREEKVFLNEFVRVGFTAQLFQNDFLESNKLIDLLIRAIPLVDGFLAFTSYSFHHGFWTTAAPALEILQQIVQYYESFLKQKKRETLRRKLKEHLRSLNHCQRARYILTHFGMLHYRIFERTFDTIRVNNSHHQAIKQVANELAAVFIQHLTDEKENIPQHLLQSYIWGNDTYLRKVWRGIKVLGGSYELHDDDHVGISTFNFHTVPVVIFKREQHQFWAKKFDMQNQASFYGKAKEFNSGQKYLGLKLIRIPYSYEQALFDGLPEEQINHEYENVTTLVQNRMNKTGQGDRGRNRQVHGFRHGGGRGGGDSDDDDNHGGGNLAVVGTFQDQDQDERQCQIAISSHLVRMEGDASSVTIEDVTSSFRSLTQSVLCENEVENWKIEIREELLNFVENKMLNDKKFKIDSFDWKTALSLSAFAFVPIFGTFGLSLLLSSWSPKTIATLSLLSGALAHTISTTIKESGKTDSGSVRFSCSTPTVQLNPAAVEILNYALTPLGVQLPENGKFLSMKEEDILQCLPICSK